MLLKSADLSETKWFALLALAKQNAELNNLEANQTIRSAQFPKSPTDNSVEQATNPNPDKEMTLVLSEKFMSKSPYGEKKGFCHSCLANLINREKKKLPCNTSGKVSSRKKKFSDNLKVIFVLSKTLCPKWRTQQRGV